jgi:hypothetical protein
VCLPTVGLLAHPLAADFSPWGYSKVKRNEAEPARMCDVQTTHNDFIAMCNALCQITCKSTKAALLITLKSHFKIPVFTIH